MATTRAHAHNEGPLGDGEAPTCPYCGSDGPFLVRVPEWAAYEYEPGEEWEPAEEYDESPIPGQDYDVNCRACGGDFDACPWE